MNAARKGRRAEHRSRRWLEAQGFPLVVRSAASKGPFDLVAVGAAGVVLCQVKSGRGPSPAERRTIEAVACPANVVRVVHIWRPRRRLPDVIELGHESPITADS